MSRRRVAGLARRHGCGKGCRQLAGQVCRWLRRKQTGYQAGKRAGDDAGADARIAGAGCFTGIAAGYQTRLLGGVDARRDARHIRGY